jgi:flagellar biosynthetic protein FliR
LNGAGLFLLGAARLVPALLPLPLNGLPRLVIALLVTLTVGPKSLPPSGFRLPGIIATEVFVGLALGLWSALPFFVARSAGLFIDRAIHWRRGPLGDTMQVFALGLWALCDGPSLLIRGLAESYQAIPMGGHPVGGEQLLFVAGARFFSATLLMSGPILLALLLGELLLGLISRISPIGRAIMVGPGPGIGAELRLPVALIALIVGLFTVAKVLSAPEQLGNHRLLLRAAERLLAK